MISHDSCVFQSLGIKKRIGLDGHDRYVDASPYSHADLLPPSEPHRRAVRGRDGSGREQRVRVHLSSGRAEGLAGGDAAEVPPDAVGGGAASLREDGGEHQEEARRGERRGERGLSRSGCSGRSWTGPWTSATAPA